jgi:membrane-associated phospholipid phosphatase
VPPCRLLVAGALLWAGAFCRAQDGPAPAGETGAAVDLSWRHLPQRVFSDECLLFSSPFRAHKRDLWWLIPLGALTGAAIASDHHNLTAHIHSTPGAIRDSDTITNVSLASLIAIPAVMAGFGRLHYAPRLDEGAMLGLEAAADGFIASEVLKVTLRRERPEFDRSGGAFFRSTWNGSFPSGHAMVSWSIASAIAHRYPGWLTQLSVYSLAAATSVPRITAEKHFPSDVLVGGVLGWLVGREVFERRHSDWNPVVPQLASVPPSASRSARSSSSTEPPAFFTPERERPRRATGPVFVPMNSWIYPALERLAALGYIGDQASGIRPWTREECARQLAEAMESSAHRNNEEAERLIAALREEFGRGAESTKYLEIGSVYARYLNIAGRPLIDGYNFGQTITNDYGRPVSEGSNVDTGFTAEAVEGRVSFYTQSEFQHSPPFASPAAELKPLVHELEPVLAGSDTVDRFDPLEIYAGVQLGGWALTVGKQELWWGPGEAGPFSFSTDAEPFYCFRFTSAAPIFLPGPFRHLGAFRADFIGGELSGHRLPPRPLLNGQKLTWNPAKSLELGFTRWSLFDGAGVHAFTAGSILRNLFANGATFGNAVDPGDRKSGFDIRWRPPAIGNRVTLYSDAYADDEPNPLTGPRRSAWAPGIYVASLPKLPHWDLRVEAPSTRLLTDHGGFFLYWNGVYNDANTNKGNLLGSWVGRDGRGLLAEATWWRTARSQWVFGYRQNRIGSAFLPGGGTQDDAFVRGSMNLTPEWTLAVSTQYERYLIPALGGLRHDVATSLQVVYQPRWRPFHN